jgi:hypothetical protein
LGKKQQHFNIRSNIMVLGPPAAQPNIIYNYCQCDMFVEYLNQWCATFYNCGILREKYFGEVPQSGFNAH